MRTLPLEDCDYFVRVVPFGVPIPAALRLNSDDTYSLYFNDYYYMDPEQRLNAYEHELNHMVYDDMYSEESAWEIEQKRGE